MNKQIILHLLNELENCLIEDYHVDLPNINEIIRKIRDEVMNG